jgi:hypothetical protein
MKTKLTLLLLVSIFIFGCAESNPYLGKWHSYEDGEDIVIEILESGNWIHHDPDGIETHQWLATEGGIVLITNLDRLTACVHEDLLLVTEGREKTYTFKRVK